MSRESFWVRDVSKIEFDLKNFKRKDIKMLEKEEKDFEEILLDTKNFEIRCVDYLFENPYSFDFWIAYLDHLYDFKDKRFEKLYKKVADVCFEIIQKERKSIDSWGFFSFVFPENRSTLRLLERYGIYLWNEKKIEDALNLFKYLLEKNPLDNHGVRFFILAIRKNLTFEKMYKNIKHKEGNSIKEDFQTLNFWFSKNRKGFEEDFLEWEKNMIMMFEGDTSKKFK